MTLAKEGVSASCIDRILFFHSVKADALLRFFVIEVLGPQNARVITSIDVNEVCKALGKRFAEDKTTALW